MKELSPQLKHDFINNSLRIEVLSKIICEDLSKNKNPNPTQLNDMEDFLLKEINLIKEIKDITHSH
jgi:hypothetical protein